MPVKVGDIVEGKVTDIMNYGVFIKLENGKSGLVHISEVSKDYVEDIHTVLASGDVVKVKVLSIDENGKIALSIKKALPPSLNNKNKYNDKKEADNGFKEPITLDDMLSKFLKDSDEKQLNLKKNMDSKRGYSKKHSWKLDSLKWAIYPKSPLSNFSKIREFNKLLLKKGEKIWERN